MLVADFEVATPAECDHKLSQALSLAQVKAGNGKAGILVVIHLFYQISVAVTPAVPYGFIHERDHAQR